MDSIRKQARIARRRLTAQRFWRFLPWTLSIGLVVAISGLALPKWMHLAVDPNVWFAGWVGGCSVVALVTNLCLTFLGRPSLADAAVEIDHRFELQERLSSALVLAPEDRETELGRALVADADRRAEKLDVRDAFPWGLSRRLLIPVLPALLAVGLLFVPDRAPPELAAQVDSQSVNQVKNSTKPLLEQIKKKRIEAEKQGLTAAVDMFQKMEAELAKLQKNAKLDTKQQLAKLNDIKEQLKQRREELGTADTLRNNLKNLEKFEAGPAEKLADALKKGDFEKAEESLSELLKKMQSGEMDSADAEKLEKQLEQLQQAMAEAAEGHEQAKQALREQIAQAEASGDMQKAAQLQRKLEQAQALDANMDQMQQMAEMLSQAQQSMQQGDMQEAQEALQQMASQLQQMNDADAQLQDLDELMDSLAQSRSQMMCKQCQGAGCQSCMMGSMPGQMPGQGMGEGNGSGERPESETDTDFFDSQVRDQMKAGETVYAGQVGGENKKGLTKVDIQDAVLTSLSEEPEPLEDTPLPKTQLDHTRDYFNSIREGK